MKIVLASGNAHKIREIETMLRGVLPDVRVVSMRDVGIADDIVEDGTSFEENARIKSRTVASHGFIGVGDDSGLAVDALGGAPGIYSARYAGEHGNDEKNNEKLLRELEDKEDRGAAFVCTIACTFPDGREFCVRGEVRGEILRERHGDGGFGYDPLFFYPPLGKTFAELDAGEKNAVSHRSRAVGAFVSEFLRRVGNEDGET